MMHGSADNFQEFVEYTQKLQARLTIALLMHFEENPIEENVVPVRAITALGQLIINYCLSYELEESEYRPLILGMIETLEKERAKEKRNDN